MGNRLGMFAIRIVIFLIMVIVITAIKLAIRGAFH
jgi:hypothetical protein